MKRNVLKVLLSLCLASAIGLSFLFSGGMIASAEETEEPLLRIAFLSDLHVEFGLQDRADPVRPSTTKALEKIMDLTDGEGVDLIVVGGDMTGPRGGWTTDQISKVKGKVHQALADTTKDGQVLYVAGNHDPEPSVKYDKGSSAEYSADYEAFMKEGLGEPAAALYSDDIRENLSPYNELLCYRYVVGGVNFIGINTPYVKDQAKACGFYAEQLNWVEAELEAIGPDVTSFLISHYPPGSVATLKDSATASAENFSKGILEDIFAEYPNLVYCYGHSHSGDKWWAKTKTADLVQPEKMSLAGAGLYKTKGHIDMHMGSMGYYDTPLQEGGLTAEDPVVVQFVTVEIFTDRMVFQVYNAGEQAAYKGKMEITPFSVVRDFATQLGLEGSAGTDTSGAEGSTDAAPGTSGGQNTGAPSAEGGDMLPVILAVVVGAVAVIAVAVLVLVLKSSRKKNPKPSEEETK